jgi:adenylosuccinate lyase
MIERYMLPQMARIWAPDATLRRWLEIELLVIQARAELGELSQEVALRIAAEAALDFESYESNLKETRHDVSAFLQMLEGQLGADSRYLHHGMTSADIIDTALGLQLRDSADLLIDDLLRLASAIKEKAFLYRDTPMIGRTHGMHAMPMTFGLKMAQWYVEVQRNLARLARLRDVVSFGMISGPVGTYARLNPRVEESVCRKLGLKVPAVTTQILQRDRHAEFVSGLALVGSSVSRFATELRHLSRTEVHEVAEPVAPGQRSSTAMPHKRNPVNCERISGLSRVLRGYVPTALENIDIWHERDLSHSSAERIILPDATYVLDYILQSFTGIIQGLQVYPHRMLQNLSGSGGVIYSGQVLLAMQEAGFPREEAYTIVQEHALRVQDEGGSFHEALRHDPRITSVLDVDALSACFSLATTLQHVDYIFKRAFSPTGE